MLLLSSAITSRSVLLALLTASLAFATTACVSSFTLSHNSTSQSTEDSSSSLRTVALESQFNWSDQAASTPG